MAYFRFKTGWRPLYLLRQHLEELLFWTHTEECNVVSDEVVNNAGFLWRLPVSLEQAGGEDCSQFFAWHVIEVGTLVNPESHGGGGKGG